MSFKSCDDIERCVRSAEKIGSRILDPYPDRIKEVTKKTPFVHTKADGGSHSSSEQGYICDSEREDEKGVSDVESDFFTAPTKSSADTCLDVDGNNGAPRPGLSLRGPDAPPLLVKPTTVVASHQNTYKNGQLETGNHAGLKPSLPPSTPHILKTPSDSFGSVIPPLNSIQSSNLSAFSDNKKELIDEKPPPYLDQKPPPFLDQKPPPYLDHKPFIDQKPPSFGDFKPPQPEFLSPRDKHNLPPTNLTSPTHGTPINHNNLILQPPTTTSSFTTTTVTSTSFSTAPIPSHFNHVVQGVPSVANQNLTNGSLTTTSNAVRNPVCTSSTLGKYSVVSLVSSTTVSNPITKNSDGVYSNSTSSGHFSNINLTSTVNGTPRSCGLSAVSAGSSVLPVSHPTVHPSFHNSPSVPVTHGDLPPASWHPSTPVTATPELSKRIKTEPGEPSIAPQSSPHVKPVSHSNVYNPFSISTPATTLSATHSLSQHSSIPTPQSTHPSHTIPLSSQYRLPSVVKTEPGLASKASSPSLVPRTTASPHLGIHSLPRHSPLRHTPRSQEPPHAALYSYPGAATTVPSSSHSISKPWTSPVSSLPTSNPSHLASLPRPIIPPPSFPLGAAPPSGPLPPSGMFAPPPLPNPQTIVPPPHHLSQDPLVQADILRRELDSRFLASQDRTLGISAPALAPLGAVPALLRTDVHHHQHQHTHVHQHLLPPHMPPPPPPLAAPAPTGLFSHSAAPSLFKEVSKSAMETSVYRPGHPGSALGSSYPAGLSPLVNSQTSTPFTPPSHLLSVTPKKTGRWNAMHVRVAWEIFYDQQKQANEKSNNTKIPGPPDLLRSGPSTLGPPQMYSSLPRPPEMGQLLSSAGPSHRIEPSFLGAHISPSVSRLSGLRYGGGPSPSVPSTGTPSSFHHPGVPPTSITGPPPGSMFSRDAAPPPGLALPTPTSHDAWRLRVPNAYGTSSPSWPMKHDASYYERERREHEERQRREKEEREKKEKEERERREREELERREKEERERREREAKERERERERERRAEHEKERLARLAEAERNSAHHRRDESRSPILRPPDMKDGLLGARTKPDTAKDDVMIVGSKEGGTLPQRHPAHLQPPQPHLTPSSLMPPHSSPFYQHHSLSPHFPPTSSSASPMDRARLMAGVYHSSMAPPSHLPHPGAHIGGSWPDPFRDPYRTATALHDPLGAARAHELAAREAMMGRDALREQLTLDRAREEHFLRTGTIAGTANPLNPLIWNERYREHQAREMIDRERERQMVAAAAAAGIPHGGLYPPSGSSHFSSLLPHSIKNSGPHAPGLNHGFNPQHFGAVHPGPSHMSSLGAPGMPPPLLSTLRGPSSSLPRPPDKKEPPR